MAQAENYVGQNINKACIDANEKAKDEEINGMGGHENCVIEKANVVL